MICLFRLNRHVSQPRCHDTDKLATATLHVVERPHIPHPPSPHMVIDILLSSSIFVSEGGGGELDQARALGSRRQIVKTRRLPRRKHQRQLVKVYVGRKVYMQD